MKVMLSTAWLSRSGGGIPPVVEALAGELQRIEGAIGVQVVGLQHPRDPQVPGALLVQGPRAFGYAPQLREHLRQAECDIVHQHGIWVYPSVAVLDWSVATGRPRIISPHGMLDPWALGNAQWKKRLAWRLYEGRNLRGAACLHALNEAEAAAIRACGLRSPIVVIPNGVDMPGETGFAMPGWRTGIPDTDRILLFLGRIHPKKGLSELIEAWSTLGAERYGWHLVLAGWDDGGHLPALQKRIEAAGLSKTASYIGPQYGSDKHATYAAADAFVLPSHSEGLPMAVLEAWSHGLPVLMTPQCNLAEGRTAGAAVEILPEPRSIAEGLRILFAMSDDERRRMGRRGQELVQRRFTWSSVARQMRDVYAWVLGGGQPPACVMTD